MLIKWLDFADLHFSFSNADTENLRAMLKKDIVDLGKTLGSDPIKKK